MAAGADGVHLGLEDLPVDPLADKLLVTAALISLVDIDKLMGTRTRARPLAAERMPPSRALEFGLALSACSFALLASTVNLLAAALALQAPVAASSAAPPGSEGGL